MEEKIAVVTGGGSGIGRRVACAFARSGMRVVLAGRRLDALLGTIAASGEAPERFVPVATDITDPEAVEHLFILAKETFGRIDILFNNAGAFDSGPLSEVSPRRWRDIIDVNVSGAFYCAQAAFRIMKDQNPRGGRIINNGSISAQSPRPNAIAYTVSKHAITGLTKSISLEGRAHDIACGQIDIGNAATEMTDDMPRGVLQADGKIRAEPTMDIGNVVRAVELMVSLPLDANIQFITVMATAMPLIGRG